jgi:hypothetical protein
MQYNEMERTLKNVVKELLCKAESLRQERDLAISRCQRNCPRCAEPDCPNRVLTKSRAPMRLVMGTH